MLLKNVGAIAVFSTDMQFVFRKFKIYSSIIFIN